VAEQYVDAKTGDVVAKEALVKATSSPMAVTSRHGR